jgi:hypothetical protein
MIAACLQSVISVSISNSLMCCRSSSAWNDLRDSYVSATVV